MLLCEDDAGIVTKIKRVGDLVTGLLKAPFHKVEIDDTA